MAKKQKTLRERIRSKFVSFCWKRFAVEAEHQSYDFADQILELVEKEKLERFNTSDKSLAEQEVLEEIKKFKQEDYEVIGSVNLLIRRWQSLLK